MRYSVTRLTKKEEEAIALVAGYVLEHSSDKALAEAADTILYLKNKSIVNKEKDHR